MPKFWERKRVDPSVYPDEVESDADVAAEPVVPPEREEAVSEASEAKQQRIRGEVASFPNVRRNEAGEVTSMTFDAKVQFKGTITIKARGDVAAAYWSITPGMKLAIHGQDSGEKEFTAIGIDVVPNV